jgi:hypothetical protein
MEFVGNLPRIGWRSLPLLVAGLIAGAFVLSPAVGEAAQFLTKKKADRRYLQNTSVATSTQTLANNEGGTFSVNCPPGRQATGGGMDSPLTVGPSSILYLEESKPIVAGVRTVGWNVEVGNPNASPVAITVYAVCAP